MNALTQYTDYITQWLLKQNENDYRYKRPSHCMQEGWYVNRLNGHVMFSILFNTFMLFRSFRKQQDTIEKQFCRQT